MRTAMMVLGAAGMLTAAWAQLTVAPEAAKTPAVAAAVSETPLVTYKEAAAIASKVDERISSVGGAKDPVDMLSTTHGVYIEGFGAVFSNEISLVVTPGTSPFHPTMSPQELAVIHQRKVAQLDGLRKGLREAWAAAATAMQNAPATDEVVLATRVLYRSYEDTKGLPFYILLRGNRKAAPGAVALKEE